MKNLYCLIAVVVAFAFIACRNGIGPGPIPDPCVEDPNSCSTPPPPLEINIEQFSVVKTEDIVANVLPKVASNGETFALAFPFTQSGVTENVVTFDAEGNKIDAITLGNVQVVNGLFPSNDKYELAAVNLENGELAGKLFTLNNAGELIGSTSMSNEIFVNAAQDDLGRKFMVKGTDLVDQTTGEHKCQIYLTEVDENLVFSEPTLLQEIVGVDNFASSLEVDAIHNRVLLAGTGLNVVDNRLLSKVIIYDTTTGSSLDINTPFTNDEFVQKVIAQDDRFLVVTDAGFVGSPRKVHQIFLNGGVSPTVFNLPAGSSLIPLKDGFLSAIMTDSPNFNGTTVKIQNLDENGVVTKEISFTDDNRLKGKQPTLTIADKNHLAVTWGWEDTQTDIKYASTAFLTR